MMASTPHPTRRAMAAGSCSGPARRRLDGGRPRRHGPPGGVGSGCHHHELPGPDAGVPPGDREITVVTQRPARGTRASAIKSAGEGAPPQRRPPGLQVGVLILCAYLQKRAHPPVAQAARPAGRLQPAILRAYLQKRAHPPIAQAARPAGRLTACALPPASRAGGQHRAWPFYRTTARHGPTMLGHPPTMGVSQDGRKPGQKG